MKKRVISSLAVLSCCITLSGCGINASIEPMTYDYQQAHKTAKKPANKNLIHAITVAEVKGGHTINPLLAPEVSNENYKLALEKSLQNAQLLQEGSPGDYSLQATIERFERPIAGFDFTATLVVNYKLTKSNKIIFDKTITSSHTAKMSDSFIGVTRLKMANEGSARNNIKQLINDLYKI